MEATSPGFSLGLKLAITAAPPETIKGITSYVWPSMVPGKELWWQNRMWSYKQGRMSDLKQRALQESWHDKLWIDCEHDYAVYLHLDSFICSAKLIPTRSGCLPNKNIKGHFHILWTSEIRILCRIMQRYSRCCRISIWVRSARCKLKPNSEASAAIRGEHLTRWHALSDQCCKDTEGVIACC